MGLAAFQNALSQLLTDEVARIAFVDDPATFGAGWQLSQEEINALQEMAARDIPQFAHSLHSKRCAECGDLLPQTRQALGENFSVLFMQHAKAFTPCGAQKVRADALTFALWLQKQENLEKTTREVARYESFLLQASDSRWQIGVFKLLPGRMLLVSGRGRVFQWPHRKHFV